MTRTCRPMSYNIKNCFAWPTKKIMLQAVKFRFEDGMTKICAIFYCQHYWNNKFYEMVNLPLIIITIGLFLFLYLLYYYSSLVLLLLLILLISILFILATQFANGAITNAADCFNGTNEWDDDEWIGTIDRHLSYIRCSYRGITGRATLLSVITVLQQTFDYIYASAWSCCHSQLHSDNALRPSIYERLPFNFIWNIFFKINDGFSLP